MPKWPKNPYKQIPNVTNRPGFNSNDVYGNTTWKQGDEFPPFSTRDPAGSGAGPAGIGIGAPAFGPLETENPFGGDAVDPSLYCDTCGVPTNIIEMATPAHLEHNIRYGGDKNNFDIANKARAGGEYNIGWETTRYSPAIPGDGTVSRNPGNPAGPDNLIPSKSLPADMAAVNPPEFNEGSFSGANPRTALNLNGYRPVIVDGDAEALLGTVADQIIDKTQAM